MNNPRIAIAGSSHQYSRPDGAHVREEWASERPDFVEVTVTHPGGNVERTTKLRGALVHAAFASWRLLTVAGGKEGGAA